MGSQNMIFYPCGVTSYGSESIQGQVALYWILIGDIPKVLYPYYEYLYGNESIQFNCGM